MKKSEKLCDEMELIDEKYIEEAEQAAGDCSPVRRRTRRRDSAAGIGLYHFGAGGFFYNSNYHPVAVRSQAKLFFLLVLGNCVAGTDPVFDFRLRQSHKKEF